MQAAMLCRDRALLIDDQASTGHLSSLDLQSVLRVGQQQLKHHVVLRLLVGTGKQGCLCRTKATLQQAVGLPTEMQPDTFWHYPCAPLSGNYVLLNCIRL